MTVNLFRDKVVPNVIHGGFHLTNNSNGVLEKKTILASWCKDCNGYVDGLNDFCPSCGSALTNQVWVTPKQYNDEAID